MIPKVPDILDEVFYMVKKKTHLGPHDSFSVSWWLRVCRGYFQQQLDPLFSLECWQVYPSSLHLRTTSCCVLKLDRNKLERVWNWFQKSIGSSYPKPLKVWTILSRVCVRAESKALQLKMHTWVKVISF